MGAWRENRFLRARPAAAGIAGLALILAVTGSAAAQTPGTYQIDPHASRIEVDVFRGGLLGGLGDNHVILIADFSGATTGSRDGKWQVNVVAQSASLTVADKGISDSTRQQIQNTMVGPSQVDAARFPTIELHARAEIPGNAPQNLQVEGELTLHGVRRRVEFPVVWSQNGDSLRVEGRAKLRLRDFNIEPISRGLGTVKVKNEFAVIYSITLHRVAAGGM
jgi:polyisoprenoid-binding protein YceI